MRSILKERVAFHSAYSIAAVLRIVDTGQKFRNQYTVQFILKDHFATQTTVLIPGH
jgi:hypothetical protein